jgi:acetyl-CoA acetyltransferase family protein
MRFENVFLPYGAWWSTPFCRWQGSLAGEHPLKLAARCGAAMLDAVSCPPQNLDALHFGMSVPQHQSFWGAPWIAAMMGADAIAGPTISQACATSARVLASAAADVALGEGSLVLALAADRISNGPHIYYPDPSGPGGMGVSENWVWDNFRKDPYANVSMVQTAENIAARFGFSRQQQDDLTLHRYSQYCDAMKDERAFQKKYMQAAPVGSGRPASMIEADEGVVETTRAGLERLSPVVEGGTVTYAAQTHPADGNAGLLLGSRERAAEHAKDAAISVQLLSYGQARAEKAHMGMAPVPAAQAALKAAGIAISDIAAVKTHNPFAVNDLYFAQETGYPAEKMNNYGSSLIFGHPQGPTGMRLVIELVEELAGNGGGYGLFTGCAAGDTGAAVVIKVA